MCQNYARIVATVPCNQLPLSHARTLKENQISAMCFISLSLSICLVIYIMGFVNIVESYDVSPLYTLVVMNGIFTLWSFVLSDWMFRFENTWCMSCRMNTWGDNGLSYWFTWYILWHSTCGFPRWHWGNLCIGVDACFYYLFSDRNFGVPL